MLLACHTWAKSCPHAKLPGDPCGSSLCVCCCACTMMVQLNVVRQASNVTYLRCRAIGPVLSSMNSIPKPHIDHADQSSPNEPCSECLSNHEQGCPLAPCLPRQTKTNEWSTTSNIFDTMPILGNISSCLSLERADIIIQIYKFLKKPLVWKIIIFQPSFLFGPPKFSTPSTS